MSDKRKTEDELLEELTRLRRVALELDASEAERKRALEAREASEERFRSLHDNIPVGVFRTSADPAGRILSANPALARMFGYESADDMSGLRVSDLYVNRGDRRKFRETVTSARVIADYEVLFRRRDGGTFWGSISARAVPSTDGEIAYFDGVIEDITERRKAGEARERRAQESAVLARLTAELIGKSSVDAALAAAVGNLSGLFPAYVSVNLLDDGGRFLDVRAHNMDTGLLGFVEKLIGRGYAGWRIPLYEGSVIAETIWTNRPTVCNVDFEIDASVVHVDLADLLASMVTPDSPLRKFVKPVAKHFGRQSFLGIPFLDETGEILGTLSLMREKPFSRQDFDLGKAMANVIGQAVKHCLLTEAVRASEERYRTLQANIPVGVFRSTADTEGRILSANPAMIRMFGYGTMSQAADTSFGDLFPDAESRRQFVETLTADGVIRDYEVRLNRRDGSSFMASITAQAVPGADVKTSYFDGVVSDITERVRAEEERDRHRLDAASAAGDLQALVDNVDVLLWSVRVAENGDLYYERVNDAFAAVEGKNADFYNGRRIEDIATPDQFEAIQKRFRELSARETHTYETSFGPKGKERHFKIKLIPATTAEGRITRFIGAAEDVTESKRVEYELKRHIRALEGLNAISKAINSAPDLERLVSSAANFLADNTGVIAGGIYLFSEGRDYLRLAKAFGPSPEIYREREILDPADPHVQLVLSSPVAVFLDDWAQTAKETENAAEASVVNAAISCEGGIIGILSLTLSEADRHTMSFVETTASELGSSIRNKRIERARRENEETSRVLLNAPANVAFLINTDGEVLNFNETARSRTRLPEEELRGRSLWTVLPEAVAGQRRAAAQKAVKTGKPVHFQETRGRVRYRNYYCPLKDEADTVARIAIFSWRIEAQVKIEDESTAENEFQAVEEFLLAGDASGALAVARTPFAFLVDPAAAIEEINDPTARRVGVPVAEVIGRPFADYLPPALARSRRGRFDEVLRAGEAISFCDEFPGGVYENDFYPIVGDDGAVTTLAYFSRDVTEQKRAEEELDRYRHQLEALVDERTEELRVANVKLQREIGERKRAEAEIRKSEETYRRLYDTTQALADQTELDEVLRQIADQAMALLGAVDCTVYLLDYERGVLAPIYASSAKDRDAIMAFTLRPGEGLTGRVARDGKGQYVNVGADDDLSAHIPGTDSDEDDNQSVMAVPMFNAGNVLGVLTISQEGGGFDDDDLAKLTVFARQAEIAVKRARDLKAVRDSEERYRSLVETIHDGFAIVDGEENILFVNQAYCNILGYTRAELVEMNIRDLIPEGEIPKTLEATRAKRDERRSTKYEVRMQRKDGELRDVLVSSTPLLDENGEYKLTIGVALDITDQKRTEAELELRTRQLEIAHRRADDLLRNILPEQVITELDETSTSPPRLVSEATIVFVDVVGFSRISSRVNHKALLTKLSAYFHAFDLVVRDCGLEKLKTVGDGYMYAGGLFAESNQLEECADAAIDILKFVGTRDWQVRVGVHVGPCIAGLVKGWRMVYDVWGETVNFASRLNDEGEPGRINVSEAVYEGLKNKFEFEARGEVRLAAFGAVPMYYLLGRKVN
ncbi:MAG: PAS domain S-box protein [Candidatus Zixiibacteriota bacterium]